MIEILVIVIIVLCILYVLLTYNSFVRLKNRVQEAFATMDVYLKKRWDLIPNIVKSVASYAKHEKETLANVVELRNSAYDKMSLEEKLQTNEVLTKDLDQILLLAENYPELKASENFQSLNKELSKIEEDIANARKYYNAVVRTYNDKVEMFPSNLLAKLFRYSKKRMFEVEPSERSNVSIDFK